MVHTVGTPGNDSLTGTATADTLEGLAGNDVLIGQAGDDLLYGGDGNDQMSGGPGKDLLDGGAGNDTLRADIIDHVDGGDGQDTLFVTVGANTVLITNTAPGGVTHASTGLEFQNIEILNIIGSDGPSRIDGGNGNDIISAAGGSHVFGRGGDDHLTLTGYGGDLVGGDGNDLLGVVASFQDVDANTRLQGGNGDDVVTGGFHTDRLDGDAGNDTLTGNDGSDFLYGGDGNDKLVGDITFTPIEAGEYSITGGNDVLQGGAGDDELIGGRGKDTLTGGAGADRFEYFLANDSLPGAANRDVITDFSQVDGDRVDLSGYYVTDLDRSPIQSVFAFIGTAAFTGPNPTVDNEGDIINYNGQLNYHYDGANTVVSGDANGDKIADFEVVLFGHLTLTATDFML